MDTIENDPEMRTNTNIAQIYFRLDTDKVEHTREVYRLMDWLGDIGGVYDVLSYLIMILFGGYLHFNHNLSTMMTLYSEH